MGTCLHIGHPIEPYAIGLREITIAFAKADFVRLCPGWTSRISEYDSKNSLSARDFCSAVTGQPGPALLLRPIQARTLQEIRARLEGRQIVFPVEAYDAEALTLAVQEIQALHAAGEPLLPLDHVVALLLMRKLDRERMWTGNSKGYMWRDDLPNGRGVDEKFRPRVQDVVNILLQNDVLVFKTSNGGKKFALNPLMREEIYEILKTRTFPARLALIFSRQAQTASARELDLLNEFDEAEGS